MKKLFLMLPLLALLACSQQDGPAIPESGDNSTASVSYFVPLDEAVEIAKYYVGGMGGDNTRANSLEVSDVDFYGNANTRSTQPDTTKMWGYYIINFADNNGFALVAADRRNQPLYALSDSGTLNLSDTISNGGLRTYLSTLPNIPGAGGVTGEPIWTNPIIPPVNPDPVTPSGGVELKPLIAESVRNWDQGAPFNAYCVNPNNVEQLYPVGCTAVAVGTIMSYYRWPQKYKSYTFNWTSMLADHNCKDIARLMKELGNPENLDMDYNIWGSSSTFSRFIPTFTNMGYQTPRFAWFNETEALRILRTKQPLLIGGEGHAWVLDGIYWTKQLGSTMTGNTPEYTYNYFIHCDWGWGGQNNGYYSFSNSTIPLSPQAVEKGEVQEGLPDTFYIYKLRMMYDFQKNSNY